MRVCWSNGHRVIACASNICSLQHILPPFASSYSLVPNACRSASHHLRKHLDSWHLFSFYIFIFIFIATLFPTHDLCLATRRELEKCTNPFPVTFWKPLQKQLVEFSLFSLSLSLSHSQSPFPDFFELLMPVFVLVFEWVPINF